MLFWLGVRYNTERLNFAYAAYHGRFSKTIWNKTDIYWDFYDLDYLVRVVCIEVLSAHSEIVHFFERKATGSSVKLLQHYNLGVHIGDYKPYYWLKFSIIE